MLSPWVAELNDLAKSVGLDWADVVGRVSDKSDGAEDEELVQHTDRVDIHLRSHLPFEFTKRGLPGPPLLELNSVDPLVVYLG